MTKILLIEDDKALRRELTYDLQHHGYEVTLVDDFDQTEQILKAGDFRLVFAGRHTSRKRRLRNLQEHTEFFRDTDYLSDQQRYGYG